MKVFIVMLACFAALAYGEEWTPKTLDEIRAIRASCIKEYPLSEEQITKLKNFEYPDEEAVRKYTLCVSEKAGTFSPQDGYYADRLVKQFPLGVEESEYLAVVQGCLDKNEQGDSADVWAFRGNKCFFESKIGDKIKAIIKKRLEEDEAKARSA